MSGSESEPAARSQRQVGAGLLSTERTPNRGSKLACEGGIQTDKDPSDELASSRASSLPQGQCQGQNRNQPPDHRGRSVQGCYLPNEHQTVGASLLAKAVFKPIKMHRMYWPLREQARSHRVNVRVRIGTSRPITEAGRCRAVIYRTNTKPWEQACLRRRHSSR